MNEYLTDRLKPIRKNFKRINSITYWTSIDTVKIEKTTEVGETKFYQQNGQLEKILTQHFGETSQQLTEYYLLNGQLSFVFEKSYPYNHRISLDTTEMKENNNNEIFDLEMHDIQEDKSYFENGKLIHRIESGDCGAPFAKEYILQEHQRIRSEYIKLIDLIIE